MPRNVEEALWFRPCRPTWTATTSPAVKRGPGSCGQAKPDPTPTPITSISAPWRWPRSPLALGHAQTILEHRRCWCAATPPVPPAPSRPRYAPRDAVSPSGSPSSPTSSPRSSRSPTMRGQAPRMGAKPLEDILAALDQQTVTVAGTVVADKILPRLAGAQNRSAATKNRRNRGREDTRCTPPLPQVLTSIPGIGVKTARILLEVGAAPATHHSGSSIKGEPHQSRQPTTQPRLLPRRLRRLVQPGKPHLLRPQTNRRQGTQHRLHLPRPTTLRRPVRHAPQQDRQLPKGHPRAFLVLGGLELIEALDVDCVLDPGLAGDQHRQRSGSVSGRRHRSWCPAVPGSSCG
jgi:hypothetical protein